MKDKQIAEAKAEWLLVEAKVETLHDRSEEQYHV